MVLALNIGGFQNDPTDIPEWTIWASTSFLAAGTYAGGWRIIRTLGRKIVDLGPPEGFAAETVASSVLYFNAVVLGRTRFDHPHDHLGDHGGGRSKRLSAVRWNVAGNIVIGWIITFPAAAAFACLVYLVVRPLFS